MRIVKLSSLSEKERKKVLEEQEERYQQNQQESQRIQKQANDDFVNSFGNGDTNPSHTTTYKEILNSMQNKQQKRDFKKVNRLTLWDQIKDMAGVLENIGLGANNGIKSSQQTIGRTLSNGLRDRVELMNKTNDYLLNNATDENVKKKAQAMLDNTNSLISTQKMNENTQKAYNQIQEKKKQNSERIQENIEKQSNPALKKLAEINPSIGQMLPGMVGGPLGTTYFMTSAAGNYYDDAKQRGMNEEQANIYSSIMGIIEGATESIGAKLTTNVGKQLLRKNIKGALINYGLDIGENFLEESIVEPISELVAQTTAGKDKANWDNMKGRMIQSGIDGALTAVITGSVSGAVGNIGANIQDNIENKKANKNADYWIDKAQQIVNENTDNKVINKENKMPQNGFSQAEKTETLRQEARNKLESIKQNYDEKSYNQMQEFIETAPSEKALSQVINDLNKEVETKQVAPINQKQEIQLPMKQETQNRSFEDVAFDAMNNYESNEVESPLKNRDMSTIGKQTNVNAYQYDNPKVKPYFQEMAQQMGEDLAYISSSDNRSTQKGGGTKLSATTKAMDILHNEQGYSYNQIAQGLQNIIDDKGSENNAISKKIELVIDEQLRNGYTNALGKNIEPNQEYINTITEQYSLAEQIKNVTNNQEQVKIDSENFAKQVDEYVSGKMKSSDLINVGKTPQVLQNIGVPNNDIILKQSKLKTIMQESSDPTSKLHGLPVDVVKRIPEALASPLNVLQSSTDNNSIVVITDLADKAERPIIASIEMNYEGQIGNLDFLSNRLTSAYGKNNYDRFMQTEIAKGNLLYDIDEGIIKELPASTKVQSLEGLNSSVDTIDHVSTSNKSIPQNEQNVKSDSTNINNMQNNQENIQENTQNPKVKFDNEVMKTNSEIKGNSETSEKVAKILSEPTKNVKPEQRTWAILKANFIDKGAVFEKISQKTNNRDLQGKYDYTLTAGARGQYAIGNDRYVYTNGKKTLQSKSLTSIMDEVGENTQAFNEYMYHQLNVHRMTLDERFGIGNKPVFGESITADVSRAEIAKIEEQHPEFKEYANDVYKYLEANKQELVDRGVISQETSDFFKERYPHYVPIQRATRKGNSIDVALDTKRTGINSPIKKAKGGNQDINPLFQTMASQTLQTYRASARNNFGLELKNTLQQMNQLNENRAIADIDDIVDTMTNEEQSNELLQPGKKGENPTFTVFEDGKKITYDISQDMYDALKPKSEILNKLDNTKLAKTGRKISNFRRGVLTEYNPIFSITNAIKDAQDVLINSQHSAKTYAKFPEAYAQIVKKGYWYNEYIQNGGEQNSYFTEGDFENIKKTKLDKAKNVLKIPFEKISSINNVIEMAPRLAEYIVSRQNGANIETAMLDASRVTTNFKAGGDITKFANRNGATFLNASVQGFQQQVRNIQEANMKGLKGWTNLALKYTVAGLPALLLNNLFWDDDDDYEQLQDYVKDNYYVVAKLPNGNFLRIPKGRMVATIQKVVSNANDFVKDGKINSDDVASTIWNDLKEDVSFGMDNLAPNNPIDNNILSPIIQVAQNKTWYGDDLVPQRLQDVPASEQADESTDKFSKWLGEKLNVSPIKINYLLDQYSGGIGDVLLPMGTPQAENNVIEDKFTTDPVMKSQYPSDFFSKTDELTVKNNSLKATDEDKLKYKYISSIQKDISELYKKKREIQSSEKTDEEKKKELKEIQKQINDFAKEGLNNVDKLNISGNTATIGDKEYYKVNDTWNVVSKDKKIEGISLSTYSDYQNRLAKEKSKLSKGKSLTEKDKNKVLLDSSYTSKEKKTIYKATTGKNDELYDNLSKLTDVNINAYLEYKLQDIKGDEDTKSNIVGKTKSGSKKANVKEYIINSNLSGIEKLYIYGKTYKFDKTEKYSMISYLAKSNLSKEDKQQVIKGLTANVEKHKDGNYYWK